jgi:glycosyltransferase involved in cell wall biosynthesis
MTEPLEPGLRGRDIVCVGFADWQGGFWTNQQHLMSRLAVDNRVLFVESLGLRRPQIAAGDARRVARRIRGAIEGTRIHDGVHVLSPLILPLHGNRRVRALNRRLLTLSVSRAARRVGFERPILWAYVPQAEVLIDNLDPALVIYHCVDDIAAQKGVDAAPFREAERRFASRADLVIASSEPLANRMREVSGNVLEAPNVADTALFSTALEPGPIDPALATLPEPRLVFVGAITATKLDLGLLAELARIRPDWSLAFVGSVGLGDPSTDISSLAALPNVHVLGPRRQSELPAVLRGASVGLIPYLASPLTASIFPMKVYEYLAAGLPVVSTPLPALSEVSEIGTAGNASEMAARIEAALSEDDPGLRIERSRAAAGHSWEARLEQLAAAVRELDPCATS